MYQIGVHLNCKHLQLVSLIGFKTSIFGLTESLWMQSLKIVNVGIFLVMLPGQI